MAFRIFLSRGLERVGISIVLTTVAQKEFPVYHTLYSRERGSRRRIFTVNFHDYR